MTRQRNQPLEGLLVVSMDQAVAAPYTASRLADAGARVIKLERPGGDFARKYDSMAKGESAYFVWLNRGKESIEINIKNPDDLALVHAMISKADVFLQNLAPGAAERAGLGSGDLRAANPRLITCDFSGYGEDGPYAEMKAYDLLIQAESGLASITGAPEGPGRVGVSVVDIATGMYAYAAVLEALLKRGVTGKGSGLKISLFDAVADWMTVPYLHQQATGQSPRRIGLAHPSICPYGAFITGSGQQVLISIQNEREWRNFCEQVLHRLDMTTDDRFSDNDRRCENRTALEEQITGVFAGLDHQTVTARLRAARIAYGSLNDVAAFAAHPQLRTVEVTSADLSITHPAPPVQIEGEPRGHLGTIPALNQHGDALRREFAV